MSIYFLNDHKVGYTLSNKILSEIKNEIKGLPISARTFYYFWNSNNLNNKYVCFVRNPFEIIMSGYFYHKKCEEIWAIKKGYSYYDYWKDHHFNKDEVNKFSNIIEFANFSNNKTYQEILNNLELNEGIKYEMNHVGKLTIEGISNFQYFFNENVLVVKFENFMTDYEAEINKIFDFLNIKPSEKLIKNINNHNLRNTDYKKNGHVTNKELDLNRYKKYFTNELHDEFHSKFNITIFEKLGYTF